MGAPGTAAGVTRRPGTGQIRRRGELYLAYGPERHGKGPALRIGTYRSRHEAKRALDEWLRANGRAS